MQKQVFKKIFREQPYTTSQCRKPIGEIINVLLNFESISYHI